MDDNGDSDASSELPPLTPSPPPIIQHLPVPTSVHAPSRAFSSSPSPPPAERTRARTKTARDPSPEQDPEMRFPRSWNDRSLLQDEPFKSWFTLRANEEDASEGLVDGSGGVKGKGKETGKEGVDWGKKMVRELRGSFGLRAAQTWFNFVFNINEPAGPRRPHLSRNSDATRVTSKDESAVAFFAEFYWGLRKIIRNSGQFLEETDEDMEKREREEERKLVRMINKERKRRGIEGTFVPPVIQTGEEEGSLGSEEEGEGVSSGVKRDDEGESGKGGSDRNHDGVAKMDGVDEDHKGRDEEVEAVHLLEEILRSGQTSADTDSSTFFGPGGIDILARHGDLPAALLEAQTTAPAMTTTTHDGYHSDVSALTNLSSSSSSSSSEDESDAPPTMPACRGLYPYQKSKTDKPSLKRFGSSRDVVQAEESAAVSTPVPAPKQRGRPRKSNPDPLTLSETISTSLASATRNAKKTRSEESKQDPGESVDVVGESDGPLRPKKKGKGRPRKGTVLSDAEADPVRVDEGHDDSHLQSAATKALSHSTSGGLGEDALASLVVQEPILNSMPVSVPTPAPLPGVSSTADTDARSAKKSAKLTRREKDEWEFGPGRNTVGACVNPANIMDSGSGKRTGRTKSRTADEVPAKILEDGPASRDHASFATRFATQAVPPNTTDSAAPDVSTVSAKASMTLRTRSSPSKASAASSSDAVDVSPEVDSVNAVVTPDEPSNQAPTSEITPVVTVKTPKPQRGKKRSRVDVEQEEIDGNAVADQEREAFEPRKTRSGKIVDAVVSRNKLAGDPGRTISAPPTRTFGKKSAVDIEQVEVEENGTAEDVVSPSRTRSVAIVEPLVPSNGGSDKTGSVSRTVHSGSVTRSTRSSKRDGPLPTSTIEVEKPSADVVKTSKKSKRTRRSEQDDSATAVVGPELSTGVEAQGQRKRKKLRSRGADIVAEQDWGGPSVAPAKDKRAKRKRADSIQGEEEDATEPSRSETAKPATRVDEDGPSPTGAPNTTAIKKSRKRRQVIDSESESETDPAETKTVPASLGTKVSAAAEAKTHGQRVGSKLSRPRNKDDTQAGDTTTTHSNSISVALPHQPSESTAPPTHTLSSRPCREASSHMQQQGSYNDKARFIDLFGWSGRKHSGSSARRITGDPGQSLSSIPPTGPSASRPVRPPAATSSNAATNFLPTPSSSAPLTRLETSRSASTLIGTQTGSSGYEKNASASEVWTATMAGKSKQKAVEVPASKTTPGLPREPKPKPKLPDFKRKPRLEKDKSNPVDTQLGLNNSPSTTMTDSGGSSRSVESSTVPDTLERTPTVPPLPNGSHFPWLVSRNLPTATQSLEISDESRVSESLDSGVEGPVTVPRVEPVTISPPQDQGSGTSASRQQTLRSAKASTSNDKPGKQKVVESTRATSLSSSSSVKAKDAKAKALESRSQPDTSSTTKPTNAYTFEMLELDRQKRTNAHINKNCETIKAFQSLHFRRKERAEVKRDIAPSEAVSDVRSEPILPHSSATPEVLTVSESDSGRERERELVDKLLDTPDTDSTSSIPLMTQVFKKPPQKPAGRSVSLVTQHPVVPSTGRSKSPSATLTETLVDHTTAETSTTLSPSSANNNGSDPIIQPRGSKPPPRPNTAKKPQQYFLPSPAPKAVNSKPTDPSRKQKATAKRKIGVLSTKESIELAMENEGPQTKKARTKSPTPSAPAVDLARGLENWVAEIDTDAGDAHESVQITPEQPRELVLPPLELPTDDELPADVPLSRPSIATVPPIWAETRQELCESFDHFNSYQGGVYFSNESVKGYLLSAFASSRDIFHHDGRLIISHGGGKAEAVHSRSGQLHTQAAGDQLADDKSIRALLNNYENRQPLVIVADDKYRLFPYDLSAGGYTYIVLGWYQITHAWAECQRVGSSEKGVVRWKFAFQWCEEQGLPWWCKKDPSRVDQPASLSLPPTFGDRSNELVQDAKANEMDSDAPIKSLAFVSAEKSKSLDMELIWAKRAKRSDRPIARKVSVKQTYIYPTIPRHICLSCDRASSLVYLDAAMCLNPTCTMFWRTGQDRRAPQKLEYNLQFLELLKLPLEEDAKILDLRPSPPNISKGDTSTQTRGMHCRQCGRLSSRFKWECWECKSCGFQIKAPMGLREHKHFWTLDSSDTISKVPIPHNDITKSPPLTWFMEDGKKCSVYLQTYELPMAEGAKIHVIRPNGTWANDRAHKIFRDYQEQATDGTLKLRRASLQAHKCRGQLLSNYFSQNSGAPYQYISGTEGTVPLDRAASAVVDALQLIHDRVNQVLELSTPATFNEILTAAYMEKQKMSFHSDAEPGLGPIVASLSLGAPAKMHFRLHSKHQTAPVANSKGSKNTLTIVLKHGDVCVQEGYDVQRLYEHTVVPANFRIAATARFIDASVNSASGARSSSAQVSRRSVSTQPRTGPF